MKWLPILLRFQTTTVCSTNFIPVALEFVLVEIVLVETVLVGDPLYQMKALKVNTI